MSQFNDLKMWQGWQNFRVDAPDCFKLVLEFAIADQNYNCLFLCKTLYDHLTQTQTFKKGKSLHLVIELIKSMARMPNPGFSTQNVIYGPPGQPPVDKLIFRHDFRRPINEEWEALIPGFRTLDQKMTKLSGRIKDKFPLKLSEKLMTELLTEMIRAQEKLSVKIMQWGSPDNYNRPNSIIETLIDQVLMKVTQQKLNQVELIDFQLDTIRAEIQLQSGIYQFIKDRNKKVKDAKESFNIGGNQCLLS